MRKRKNSCFEVAKFGGEIGGLMKDELTGLYIHLDRARVAAGVKEELLFDVLKAEDQEPEQRKSLEGVIVDKHPFYVYYSIRFDGQNTAADCSSMDGITGQGNPGGSCRTCPLNQFGSGKDKNGRSTKGKACQNKYRLFLLQSGEVLPMVLTLPASSVKSFSNYMANAIVSKGLRSYGVVTGITLSQVTKDDGSQFAQMQFALIEVLDKTTTALMAAYNSEMQMLTPALGGPVNNVLQQRQESITE